MSWDTDLERELEVAFADAVQDLPATPEAAKAGERNMKGVLDRYLREGRLPSDITGYQLKVEGGRGFTIHLEFLRERRAEEVVVDVRPKEDERASRG